MASEAKDDDYKDNDECVLFKNFWVEKIIITENQAVACNSMYHQV